MEKMLHPCPAIAAAHQHPPPRGHEECHREKGRHPAPEEAPLDRKSRCGSERAGKCKLHQQLASEELEELDAVEPVGRQRLVYFRVSLPRHEIPYFGNRLERAVEADG